MSEQIENFGATAKSLARNPLGIIALFIVMIYGLASLVTTFTKDFTVYERLPLIYFLVIFPVLVLGVFSWLVSKHSRKLYSPSDFKNEENYVRAVVGATEIEAPGQEFADTFGQMWKKLLKDEDVDFYRRLNVETPPMVKDKFPDFDRKSEEWIKSERGKQVLGRLRALRGLGFIEPKDRGTWKPDTHIVVTEFGKKMRMYMKG